MSRGVQLAKQEMFDQSVVEVNLDVKQAGWDFMADRVEDYFAHETSLSTPSDNFGQDSLMGFITALNTDFNL